MYLSGSVLRALSVPGSKHLHLSGIAWRSNTSLVLCSTVIHKRDDLLLSKVGVPTNYKALHCWGSLFFEHLSGPMSERLTLQ
jgi:hypothetical protein